MKVALKFEKDHLPLFVFALVLIKEAYIAFHTFFMDVSNSSEDNLFYSRYMSDNFAWMPLMVFFVYFYLYRVGKISNIGLKYSVYAAMLAILPKLLVVFLHVITYTEYNFWILLYYVMETLTWLLLFIFLISFKKSHFKINDEHHHSHRHGSHHSSHHHHHTSHHHHHHSSRMEKEVENDVVEEVSEGDTVSQLD